MKAVIMAGGEGTRLRPVTGALPKPLAPLLGRPMIEHIARLLKKHGFTDICVSVRYGADEIERALGDGESLGINICYRREETPLGTAGGVKNCSDFYGDDDFLVISGDAACDLDLGALYRAHRDSDAAVTLALHRSAQPLGLGLAVTDPQGLVKAFIEKPSWERVVTDQVNTGIYMISPLAMALVPSGKEFDFAKGLFPLLLCSGKKLLGVAIDGYWCDAGTPLSYYQCCVDALEGRLKLEPGEGFYSPEKPGGKPQARRSPPGFRPERTLFYTCRSRAELMGALSEELMDMGADYTDGLSVKMRRCEFRIAPLENMSAVRIAVNAEDAEFAEELAISVRELARRLEGAVAPSPLSL